MKHDAKDAQTSPRARLKVVIVGAGLGGLAAAISTARNGHEVLVLEAARELTQVDANIELAA